MSEHEAEVAVRIMVPPTSATLVRIRRVVVDHEVLRRAFLASAAPDRICSQCPFGAVCPISDVKA